MRWQSWTLIGILLAWALPVQAQQTIYWKKDRIQDDRGLTIATATPLPSDQTAPSAPTGLTYSNVTTNSARLDWSGSTDTGGSQLAGYKVYRGNLPVAAVSGTSFTDYELTPLASYTYTIVAFDNAGNHSSASSSVSFTTNPVPPANPSNLSASRISNSQINLSWTDNSTDEDGFKIERKLGEGGTYTEIDSVSANTTSYSSMSLDAGTVYYYRVRAYKGASPSGYTNDANACTCITIAGSGIVDDYDSNIVYTGTWSNADTINRAYDSTEHWSNTAQSKATFSFSGDLVRVVFVKGASFGIASVSIDESDKGNVDFYWPTTDFQQIETYSGLGSGNHTITVAVTGQKNASSTNYYVEIDLYGVNALPPPVPPTSLSATTISDSRIDLAWTDNSSNETGFKIERKTGSGGTWSQIDTVSANSTSYPNTGLSSYTAYYYRVRSYNGNGDSAYSNEVSATTNAPQPTSISFNPTSLPQGDCYTATVGNGANMTIDVQYRYDGGSVQTAYQWGSQNGSGQSSHCTGSSDPGDYNVVGIRNSLNYNSSFVSVNVTVTVEPPQPTSIDFSPSEVTEGECFGIYVGNGANMSIDVLYSYNGGSVSEIDGWADLNSSGYAQACTSGVTPGVYEIVSIRNSLNNGWVDTGASITVDAPLLKKEKH